jgi:hypothetical protein
MYGATYLSSLRSQHNEHYSDPAIMYLVQTDYYLKRASLLEDFVDMLSL